VNPLARRFVSKPEYFTRPLRNAIDSSANRHLNNDLGAIIAIPEETFGLSPVCTQSAIAVFECLFYISTYVEY
jgi:hypothetical protein